MSAALNTTLATEILALLHQAGVRTLCLCPGGRNAPLVLAAEAAGSAFERVHFFEERSAAFFALGRSRRDGRPAAVLTTSGTAAAELLPAVLEARHTGQPLIAVTADRPRRLRHTGAPQTIDQPPLFAAAGAVVLEADAPGQIDTLPPLGGPLHLNVCFDEPLVDGPAIITDWSTAGGTPRRPEPWMDETATRRAVEDFFARVKNPLVLVSTLEPADAPAVGRWLAALASPLYLEAVSQLRNDPHLQEFSLHSGEAILSSPECHAACDGILRIGGVPTPRLWRDLQNDPRPLLHVSRQTWPGLDRPEPVVPLETFLAVAAEFIPSGSHHNQAFFARDRAEAAALLSALEASPHREAALVRTLAGRLPDNARIFLGNSLPIREWDLAAPRTPDERQIFANRGVNGIDGLLSTALGLAGPDRPTAAILGDLSALYDLAGLWSAASLRGADFTLAVINNGGGRIFDRMFNDPAFLNAHQLRFRGAAEMFGWHYGTMHDAGEPWPAASPRLIEVLPTTPG